MGHGGLSVGVRVERRETLIGGYHYHFDLRKQPVSGSGRYHPDLQKQSGGGSGRYHPELGLSTQLPDVATTFIGAIKQLTQGQHLKGYLKCLLMLNDLPCGA